MKLLILSPKEIISESQLPFNVMIDETIES